MIFHLQSWPRHSFFWTQYQKGHDYSILGFSCFPDGWDLGGEFLGSLAALLVANGEASNLPHSNSNSNLIFLYC